MAICSHCRRGQGFPANDAQAGRAGKHPRRDAAFLLPSVTVVVSLPPARQSASILGSLLPSRPQVRVAARTAEYSGCENRNLSYGRGENVRQSSPASGEDGGMTVEHCSSASNRV